MFDIATASLLARDLTADQFDPRSPRPHPSTGATTPLPARGRGRQRAARVLHTLADRVELRSVYSAPRA